MVLLERILDLLPYVSKPIQYVGHELHTVQKPWEEMHVTIGLCFPDAYEVGMSHLGLHLLYSLLNAKPEVAAERFYAPFPDMEALMRAHGIPLFSLESHRPAADFDILGFSLQYELSYSNILNMLSLAGIPCMSEERTARDPLIIAGGPCSLNPEPLAEVCDLFVIGDGEHVVSQLVDAYQEWKTSGAAKQELLTHLCGVPGIYVPSLYDVRYDKAGRIAKCTPRIPEAPERIQRAIVTDLDAVPYLQAPVVPYMRTVHDRLTLEIMRGCARGCRFCQAGYIYRPLRERSPEYIGFLAKTLLNESGYDEVSLSSLSSGDYSQIAALVAGMMEMCEASHVSLALPSMRVKTLTGEIAELISRVRKTGFTIAPEAGTQRLRNVINKGISETDIFQTVEEAFAAGWQLLKLYFMIGLPTETDDDLDGLIDLVYQAHKVARRVSKARSSKHRSAKTKLHVSISSYVPKAHTPFQWEPFALKEDLERKQRLLQERIRHRAIQLKWHHVEASYLEAVFARGDRKLSRVLREAHQLGCRFDGWHEYFDVAAWKNAFLRAGIDPDFYVYRERDEAETFPWEHIDTGISRSYLWNERVKGLRAEETPPCMPHCRRCGLCTSDVGLRISDFGFRISDFHIHNPKPEIRNQQKAFRVRAVYSKTGVLRFLSHLDLGRVFQRAISRINAPIAYSQGFHPHPQIAFGPALPVGTEGLHEYVDFYFSERVDPENIVRNMNMTLPTGIHIQEARVIGLRDPSLSSFLKNFVFDVFVPESLGQEGYDQQHFMHLADTFHAQDVYVIQQFRKKTEAIDLKQFIVALGVTPGEAFPFQISMTVRTHTNMTIKPEEVLHLVFHIPYEKILDCRIVRVRSY